MSPYALRIPADARQGKKERRGSFGKGEEGESGFTSVADNPGALCGWLAGDFPRQPDASEGNVATVVDVATHCEVTSVCRQRHPNCTGLAVFARIANAGATRGCGPSARRPSTTFGAKRCADTSARATGVAPDRTVPVRATQAPTPENMANRTPQTQEKRRREQDKQRVRQEKFAKRQERNAAKRDAKIAPPVAPPPAVSAAEIEAAYEAATKPASRKP